MSIAEIDWQSKLSPDSDPPPVVFFLVQAENGEDSKKKIGAQKLLLACVSPVFKNMFYSPMKEEGEVAVKETTPEAFDAMIKYIYHPIGGEPFNRLFELLSFSTKNQISTLAAMTSDALGNLSLTRETMIFIIHSHGTIAVRKYCEVFFFMFLLLSSRLRRTSQRPTLTPCVV